MEAEVYLENERTERERRSNSAKCGHIARRIFADEPLKGKTLEFALELLSNESLASEELFRVIAIKIKNGEALNNYEKSMMADGVLTHAKLAI